MCLHPLDRQTCCAGLATCPRHTFACHCSLVADRLPHMRTITKLEPKTYRARQFLLEIALYSASALGLSHGSSLSCSRRGSSSAATRLMLMLLLRSQLAAQSCKLCGQPLNATTLGESKCKELGCGRHRLPAHLPPAAVLQSRYLDLLVLLQPGRHVRTRPARHATWCRALVPDVSGIPNVGEKRPSNNTGITQVLDTVHDSSEMRGIADI